MRKAKGDQIFKGIGEIRRRKRKTKGKKVLDLLSLEETPILFIQIKHIKVGKGLLNHWEKDQDKQLNVGDVEETICLNTTYS